MSGRTIFCMALFAALLPAQEEDLTAKPAVIAAAEKTKLTALLPTAPGFTGKPDGAAHFYSTDLFRYIDGGADAYLDYGMVAMIHQEYKVAGVDLTVDVYDLGDPLRAYGIYSAERSPDYAFVSVGAEGHGDASSLYFVQGNYYTKLQAFGDKGTEDVLRTVSRNIAGRMGQAGKLPQPVGWFPATGLVARSEKYIVKSPMGFDALAPATSVLYRVGGKETTVLASRAGSAEEAGKRLARLKSHYAGAGKVAAVEGVGGEAWRSSNQYEGDVVFFARGRYVVVVQAPPADAAGFLKELYSSIKD